ncbi:MAG: hypothetical protein K2X47_02780 [Bdellovibrionales bacterium]|nr:hypothetical protein [Bdellovibrionales bacterium]
MLSSKSTSKIAFAILIATASQGYGAEPVCSSLAWTGRPAEFSRLETEVADLLSGYSVPAENSKVVQYFSAPPAQIQPALVIRFYAAQMRVASRPEHVSWVAELLQKVIDQMTEASAAQLFREATDPRLKSDVKTALNNAFKHVPLKSWARLAKFAQSEFSEPEFEELIAFGVRMFQVRMESENNYPGLSQYLRYKLIKESLKRELGRPYEVISDITVFEAGPTRLTVSAFGTDPMAGHYGEFGFSYQKLKDIQRSKTDHSEVVTWTSGQKQRSATVLVKALGKFSLVPRVSAGPDYRGMLQDGRLTGAVLFSGNLGAFASEVLQLYDEYLLSEGFRKRSERILGFEDAQALLASKIKTMEIDYILREGHGHPSAWGLVNLTSNVRVTEYQLNRRGGKESLFLIAPAYPQDNPEDRSLTQDFLGEALRSRTRPTQEFLYVDTSCQGSWDLCALAKGVSAVGFTPVASDKEVDTFTISEGDPVYEILHGIRHQRTYQKILRAMVVTDEAGTVVDHGFTFPNSPAYLLRKDGAELKRKLPRYSIEIQHSK